MSLSSVSTHGMEHSFGPSVGQSIGRSVGLQSVLWQNGRADPDAIWDGEWGRLRDGYIRWGWLSLKGKVQFWQ